MTKTFSPGTPIWCAGCGHFSVQNSLGSTLNSLDIPKHEIFILAGIGCSGTIQNNLGTYGYHALHGRVLPTATGAAVANPDLLVIAAGGDGDGYAIGMGHLVHCLKRNPNIVYIVMNNGTYGLTKGQNSPTTDWASKGLEEDPIDAINLGLAIGGASFLARGTVTAPAMLNQLMAEAIIHTREKRGMAFLEVLSPCVTYNDTYAIWGRMTRDVSSEPGFDKTNRLSAQTTCTKITEDGGIPVGLIYSKQGSKAYRHDANAEVTSAICPNNLTTKELDSILSQYTV